MAGKTPTLQGQMRPHTGSKYAARTRRAGKLPAVIYGHQKDPAHVALDTEAVYELLHHGAHVVEVRLDDGQSETCLIKDVQYDYLGDGLVHVDLARIDLSEEVTVWVPVAVAGQDACTALQETGTYLDQSTTDLEVTCRADAIPDSVTVDVKELAIGDTITLADLTLPSGVKSTMPEDTVLASIRVVQEEPEEEQAEVEEVAEGAEPEVITEKKEEDAGGETPPAKSAS